MRLQAALGWLGKIEASRKTNVIVKLYFEILLNVVINHFEFAVRSLVELVNKNMRIVLRMLLRNTQIIKLTGCRWLHW